MDAPHPPADDRLPRRFRLGVWTVDPRAGTLRRGKETVRLEPKVMGVLRHLASNAGEVVTRDELFDAVWPGVVVTENALSRCVSDLRRALDDDPRDPAVIETIPKTGYRLLVPIEPAEDPPPWGLPRGDGVPALADLAGPTAAPEPVATPRTRGLWWGLGLAALVVLAGALAIRGGSASASDDFIAGTPRPLTAQAGSEGLAVVAPDGGRVAYVRFAEGEQTGHLEIVGVEGGTPLALTEGPGDTYPAFSPDGQHLAFLRCDGARCRPHRISALGTDERPLADLAAHPSGLAWSPDGRQIAYVEQTTESGPLRIAVLDLDTGRRRALTTPPATALGDLFPAFSPDGRHLAFVRRTDAVAGDLHVVPVAGGAPTPLTAESHQIARFCWFPDGRALLAASDRDGAFRLWRIPADGGPPTPLPLEAAVPIGPALSGDGTRLVVETWDLPIQLWRRTAGAPEPVPVAPSTRWDRMPALSPDGRRVAFVSTRSGHAELWVADLDGGDPRPITTLGGPAALTPQWSPDGRRIAFVVRTDGQSDVYAVAAEGGVPQRLTSTASDEVHPRWAPDGQTLYVGRRTDDRWGGVRLAPDGRAEVVAAPDAVVLAPSPDGQALWFARATTPGLWTLPLGPDGRPRPGAAPAPLGPDLAVGDATAWAVTRDGLLYLRRGPDGPALVRWAEGRTEVLFDDVYGLDLWAPALAASPDGTTVLLAHMGLPEIDVLVADLARR